MAKKLRKPEKKPRRKPSLNIKVSPETHKKLESMKIIPQEPFESVIRRLIEFYEQHQEAEKKPQQAEKSGSGFIA